MRTAVAAAGAPVSGAPAGRPARSARYGRCAPRDRRVRAGEEGVTRGSGGLAYQSAL